MKVKKARSGAWSPSGAVSERELGLTDDHTGIMEIEADLKPGDVLLDALDRGLGLPRSTSPPTGDCLSVIGIARELAAVLGAGLKYPAYNLVGTMSRQASA